MGPSQVPVVKDIVLLGGGHAHVAVLRHFGMRPLPGVRLTLVTRDIHTPYSGMLPGLIAGHYDYDDCHIDLGPLARFAAARLYHAEVEGLDPTARQVFLKGRPPLSYDLLSINTGSRPSTLDVPGAQQHALSAKPIDLWLQGWQALQARVLAARGAVRIGVVGGGAGGVELALATQYRLRQLLREQGDDPARLGFELLTEAADILVDHNAGVRRRFNRVLRARGIAVHTGHRVVEVTPSSLIISGRPARAVDAVLWVTRAAAPGWAREAGLAVDRDGFVQVNEHLQSVSHPEIFAAGDVAALPDPRPKSGVFAVRQGPVLSANLRRASLGRALRRYRPQRHFLGLISTGERYAVASRGPWSLQGAWLWTLKDAIDRRFMRHFNELPAMPGDPPPVPADGLVDERAREELSRATMRCGGCGAKVGGTILSRVIGRLPPQARDHLLIGLDAPDDAAVVQVPAGRLLVQSVDYFRAFIDDPYLFGQIAANHALGDLFAMGAEPHSALALATLPYAREKIVEETLFDLMSGALEVIARAGAVLAGGHSSEGAELAFGLTVNGLAEPAALLRKSGLRPGDALILTKPLGTGTLFAADMRGRAKGRWIDAAIQTMLVSNQEAADCLRRFGVSACTDVTGFGLIGHLLEMMRASRVDARITIDAVPLLDGAADTVALGILSSLQPQNLSLRGALQGVEPVARHPHYPLLFDPQTAGGLLAGIPRTHAEACVARLRECGYPAAAVIGQVIEGSAEQPRILLG